MANKFQNSGYSDQMPHYTPLKVSRINWVKGTYNQLLSRQLDEHAYGQTFPSRQDPLLERLSRPGK